MRVPSAGRRRSAAARRGAGVRRHRVRPCPAAGRGRPHARAICRRGSTTPATSRVADRLQRRLDALLERRDCSATSPGPGATDAEVNADLLLVHAVAARRGHRGPAARRRRARARSCASSSARRSGPARPPPAPTRRSPGRAGSPRRAAAAAIWSSTSRSIDGARARLPGARRARPRRARPSRASATRSTASRRAATSAGRRCGSTRSTGTPRSSPPTRRSTATARRSPRPARQLARFLAGAAPQRRAAGNLGAGLRFHYLPARGPRGAANVDSAEYANIVLSFSRFYGAGRAAGMRAARAARAAARLGPARASPAIGRTAAT